MICRRCRKGKHEKCPAVKRQADSWCDCHHRGSPVDDKLTPHQQRQALRSAKAARPNATGGQR